jgi:rubrerythrin
MARKPSYLGLLNAIANGEAEAGAYLDAWAAVTGEPHVRRALLTVAAREKEHGAAFAKRINELGFEVQPRPDPKAAQRLRLARSKTVSDLEKLEKLGFDRDPSGPDIFDRMFNDHSIDIATGALLGRYIAEERDTARLLNGLVKKLRRRTAVAA